jgi:hypothetical protein
MNGTRVKMWSMLDTKSYIHTLRICNSHCLVHYNIGCANVSQCYTVRTVHCLSVCLVVLRNDCMLFFSTFVSYLNHLMFQYISTIGTTRYTVCFQFITINSRYMFPAPVCSSSGGAVYTANGIFCVCYVSWLVGVEIFILKVHV